jgi:hypothetical protein
VLETLVELYPDKNWDWFFLSLNTSITLFFIEKHLDDYRYQWDWKVLSKRATTSFLEKNINNCFCSWDYKFLSENPEVTPEFLEHQFKNGYYHEWNWEGLTYNTSITLEFYHKHISDEWSQIWLENNPALSLSHLEESIKTRNIVIMYDEDMDEDDVEHFDWECLSLYGPESLIESSIGSSGLNWKNVSMNEFITLSFIDKYANDIRCLWDWSTISLKPNITLEFIEKNLDKPWDWNYLSLNDNITLEFIKKHIDKKWNWALLETVPGQVSWRQSQKVPERRLTDHESMPPGGCEPGSARHCMTSCRWRINRELLH